MKKNLFSAFALVAILSSCSKSDVITPQTGALNPNRMTFGATTTRAAENDIDNVANGFQIFGKTADAAEWYAEAGAGDQIAKVDGTNNYFKPTAGTPSHVLAGWAWESATTPGATLQAPLWPESGYPMTFYANYPDKGFAATKTDTAMAAEITVSADRFSQVDELSAIETTNQMPSDGRLSLTFDHILSKVNVAVTANTGYLVEIQSAKFVKVKGEGTFDYKQATTDDNTAWSSIQSDQSYEYRRTVFAGSANATTKEWQNPASYLFSHIGTGEAASFVHNNATTAGDLMLIPQTHPETSIVSGDYDQTITNIEAGVYLEVIYRMEDAAGNNILGLDDISQGIFETTSGAAEGLTWEEVVASDWGGAGDGKIYPGYTAADADGKNDYQGTGEAKDTDALYVKAYFPLYTAGGLDTWTRGTAYLYNLQMGSTGAGYYADDEYYDEAGNQTGIFHPGKPGQPVAEKRMHFEVSASTWADGGSHDL